MATLSLRSAREARGWSQARVAEYLGVSTRTVNRWEQGRSQPYPYYREKLAALFKLSPQQLGFVPGDLPLELLPSSSSEVSEDQQRASGRSRTDELPAETILDPFIPFTLGQRDRLLGREEILKALKARLFDRASSPMLALNGIPGIGKTSLAAAIAKDPEVQRHFSDGILWASLGPRPDVVALLARWGHLLGLTASDVEDAREPQAWNRALSGAIGHRRMLLVIDDAWGHAAAKFLSVGGPRCAQLLTTRLPPVATAFTQQGAIVLHELSEEAGLALLSRYVPDLVQADPTVARELVQTVGGLPLALTLIGTFLATQTAAGQVRRLQQALQQVRDAQQRVLLSIPVPPVERPQGFSEMTMLSLQAAITVSMQHLSDAAREALQALAIYPARPNSFSEEAALWATQTSIEVLDELWEMGLLEHNGLGRYMLHQTIVDVASVQQAPGQRTLVEARLTAGWLPLLAARAHDYNLVDQEWANVQLVFDIALHKVPPPADLLTAISALQPYLHARGLLALAEQYVQYGLDQARQLNDAMEPALLRDLAEITFQRGEYVLVEQAVTRGLQMTPSDEVRCDLLRIFGRIRRVQGKTSEAQEELQGALDLARRLQDWPRVGRCLRDLGEIALRLGSYEQARALFEEGLVIGRQHELYEQSCRLLVALAGLAWERGELLQAEHYTREGLVLARQHGYRSLQYHLLEMHGVLEGAQGHLAASKQAYEQALAIGQSMGSRVRISALFSNLADNANRMGDYAQGANYAREALQLARQMGTVAESGYALVNLGVALGYLGDEREAVSCFEEALGLSRASQHVWLVASALYAWGRLLLLQDRIGEAAAQFQQLLTMSGTTQRNPVWGARARWGLARVARARGDLAEARQLGETSLKALRAMHDAEAEQISAWLVNLSSQDNASQG